MRRITVKIVLAGNMQAKANDILLYLQSVEEEDVVQEKVRALQTVVVVEVVVASPVAVRRYALLEAVAVAVVLPIHHLHQEALVVAVKAFHVPAEIAPHHQAVSQEVTALQIVNQLCPNLVSHKTFKNSNLIRKLEARRRKKVKISHQTT